MGEGRPVAATLVAAATTAVAAATPLPTGFGPVSLGTPWNEVVATAGVSELTRATSSWEQLVRACGYHSAELRLEGGRLLITAQASQVTGLSYATPIAPGSDLAQVAAGVMRRYGPPLQTTLRDAFGAIIVDESRARHVVLEYGGQLKARFAVSGAPLWEYRVSVEDHDARRLENRTLRCARRRQDRGGAVADGPS
jgi:hypothetical protein